MRDTLTCHWAFGRESIHAQPLFANQSCVIKSHGGQPLNFVIRNQTELPKKIASVAPINFRAHRQCVVVIVCYLVHFNISLSLKHRESESLKVTLYVGIVRFSWVRSHTIRSGTCLFFLLMPGPSTSHPLFGCTNIYKVQSLAFDITCLVGVVAKWVHRKISIASPSNPVASALRRLLLSERALKTLPKDTHIGCSTTGSSVHTRAQVSIYHQEKQGEEPDGSNSSNPPLIQKEREKMAAANVRQRVPNSPETAWKRVFVNW